MSEGSLEAAMSTDGVGLEVVPLLSSGHLETDLLAALSEQFTVSAVIY
jgi:hypothetical protein